MGTTTITKYRTKLMYPKNAASPERIAVGAVVLIADGTVQTSGVSIKVTPQGGAAAAGGGTTSYVEGIVHYLPTQAETNYSSFTVTAYKASCIPVPVTVVTTASATAGYAGLDWAKVTNPTTTVDLSSTSINVVDVLTGHTVQTGDTYALASGASGFAATNTVVDGIQTDLSNATDGLGALKTLIDGVPTTAEFEARTLLAASYGDATAANQATIMGYIDTEVGAIKSVTDLLPDGGALTSLSTATALAAIDTKIGTPVVNVSTDIANTKALLPTSLAADGSIKASVESIKGVGDTADRLERGLKGNVLCTVGIGSSATSIVTSACDPAGVNADQFKGKIVTFAKDTTTAALRGQATDITAATAAALPVFTVTTMVASPVSGDTFVVT